MNTDVHSPLISPSITVLTYIVQKCLCKFVQELLQNSSATATVIT